MSTFPKEALSQHIAVLGKTGSGKSYAVRGIVEGLLDDCARVCIVDPTSAWHGLRSSVTGKSGGYPVVIFGGEHGDLPLSGTHGEAIAETIGTTSTPAIIDTRLMRTRERVQFFTDFAEGILRKNKGPLHLVIDEAHIFAPQGKVSDPKSGEMLHAANNLVSLGRSRGLRIILITQRPAKLHKDSLTQVETMVAMRLIAPQDRKAVEEWIKDNADDAKGKEILSSLATLKTGTGWVWSPELNILEKIAFPKIRTFDTGRAPDGSEAKGQVLAPIDVEKIAAKLKTVAADALANDPTALKKRIAELERQAKQQPPVPAPDDPAAEQEAYQKAWADGFEIGYVNGSREVVGAMRDPMDDLETAFAAFKQARHTAVIPDAQAMLKTIGVARPENPNRRATNTAAPQVKATVPAPARARQIDGRASSLSKAALKILAVLSQFPEGCEAGKLTLLTGYRFSGGFRNLLSELRTGGYLSGSNTGVMQITAAGEAQGPFPPLPTGQDLVDYWVNHPSFGKAAKAVLIELSKGRPMTAEQLSAATGYEYSGGFRNALSELRTAGVLVGRNTEAMRISPEIVS